MKVALFEKPHSLTIASKPLRDLRADEDLVKIQACERSAAYYTG